MVKLHCYFMLELDINVGFICYIAYYRKMGNFPIVQFMQYFAISREPQKLKSAKYFPTLTILLLTFVQNNNCVSIYVPITAHKVLFFID